MGADDETISNTDDEDDNDDDDEDYDAFNVLESFNSAELKICATYYNINGK